MTKMQQPIRLPNYTLLRHESLMKHFCLDLATVAGEERFADLLSNTNEQTRMNIAAAVQAKFQEPVTLFLKQLAATNEDGSLNLVDAARETIFRQVERVPVVKKINYCRALVTCGLLSGSQIFPEEYVSRIHMIRHTRGSISDNLETLVPQGVDSHELAATRNMQILVTKMEADLGQRWLGSKPDKQEPAKDWPQDDGCNAKLASEQKLKVMIQFLQKQAAARGIDSPKF